MSQPVIRTTKAKTWAAGIGAVCTVVAAVFADDVLDVGEVASLISAIAGSAATVYAVYKTPNRPAP